MGKLSRKLLAMVVAVAWPALSYAQLRCDEPEVRLGDIKAGKALVHRFSIYNRGPAEERITEVRPSCGCLRPKIHERNLQPGQFTELILEANTLTQPSGPNAWKLEVFSTSNGEQHVLSLTLFAQITTEITVQPPLLVLQTSSQIASEIVVTDARPQPLQVQSAAVSSDHIAAEVQPGHRGSDGKWVQPIRIRVTSTCPEGRHDEIVRIRSSDLDYGELQVPVTVVKKSRGTVAATPESISVDLAAGQALPSSLIRLRTLEESEIVLTKVSCDQPGIRCSWAKGPGNMATIKLQYDQGKLPGDGFHTVVNVQIATPKPALLSIPVTGVPR